MCEPLLRHPSPGKVLVHVVKAQDPRTHLAMSKHLAMSSKLGGGDAQTLQLAQLVSLQTKMNKGSLKQVHTVVAEAADASQLAALVDAAAQAHGASARKVGLVFVRGGWVRFFQGKPRGKCRARLFW